MTNIITYQNDRGQLLDFDTVTGSVVTPISDQDAIYWAEYFGSFTKGLLEKLSEVQKIAPEFLTGVNRFIKFTIVLDGIATLTEIDAAPNPRAAVVAGARGIGEIIAGISAGLLTGLAVGGLAAGSAVAWFGAFIGIALIGSIVYFNSDIWNNLIADLFGAVGGALFDFGQILGDLYHFLTTPLFDINTDPLTLDLDGDGIELISLANSTTHFDLDGNGFAERTGWVAADDGMLVRDGNRNGLPRSGNLHSIALAQHCPTACNDNVLMMAQAA